METNDLLAAFAFTITLFGLIVGSKSLIERNTVINLGREIKNSRDLLRQLERQVAKSEYFSFYIPAVLDAANSSRLNSIIEDKVEASNIPLIEASSSYDISSIYRIVEEKVVLQTELVALVAARSKKEFVSAVDTIMAFCLESDDFEQKLVRCLMHARQHNFFDLLIEGESSNCLKYFDEQMLKNLDIYIAKSSYR